ncbi:MAG: NYN domain-containing protein, partial [bacterium]
LAEMVRLILKPGQQLLAVKYCTTRALDPRSERRQAAYLHALRTEPLLEIHFGQYKTIEKECSKCGNIDIVPVEKMTDVNLAKELLCDLFLDRFDVALLVTADSDLLPVLELAKAEFPRKFILPVFPPARASKELEQEAGTKFNIGENILRQAQFPLNVQCASGRTIQRPPSWK